MAKTPITHDDLQQHLVEQIQFLKASCDAYDNGFDAEAKRIATVVRVLVHDTASSHSLLGQLSMKVGYFFDSAPPLQNENLLSQSPLLMIGTGKDTYLAPLDSGPTFAHRGRPFSGWWDDPIFKDHQGRELSRRELILTAANQDGGAHIDPALNEAYAELAKNNSLGWTIDDGGNQRPMSGAVKAAIRQIGHEMLRTLEKGYRKEMPSDPSVGLYVHGASMVAGAGPPPMFKPPNALYYSPPKPKPTN